MKQLKTRGTAVLSLMCLAGALAGCVGYVEGPPPPAYEAPMVMVHEGYVYYPEYQVYYSSGNRNFVYQDGRSWVIRPAPPRVSIDVLFASPSVRLDFRGSPSVHHSQVVRQYPRHWRPSNPGPDRGRIDGRDWRDGRDDRGGRGR